MEGNRVRARHVLSAGEECFCALSWAEDWPRRSTSAEANARIDATTRFWRAWLGRARMPDHRWRDPIQRSALAIKGLTYMPTGATVAALTTSLPETPGGERNWDYRYTWMRDTTFTLQALHFLNLDWEADEFMQFVADLEPTETGALQIMYGIDGRRDLTESTRDDLSGYAGARPVRIGNGAFDQRQNDVFGAVLDSVLLHTRRSQRLPRRLWPIVQSQARCASEVWREPDQGIWEARGKPQHYVSSKLMGWVALDRASKLAEIRGDAELTATWRDDRRRDQGRHPGERRRRPGRPAPALRDGRAGRLDAAGGASSASSPPRDERLRASVLAIADELTENGFVLRYRTDETDDGLSGKEGTFLICSFWLVSALSIIGEEQRAQDLMERLLRVASPLGLFAEEFDVETGRHLGNFPQAFSHLALIEAAARIIASREGQRAHVSGRRARGRRMQAPPSGEQYGIAHGDSEAVITQVGATLRHYSVGALDVIDGFDVGGRATDGRGQVLAPWPNRLTDGHYEYRGRECQAPLNEIGRHDAIHGLVRWLDWTLVERDPACGHPGLRRTPATRLRVAPRPPGHLRAGRLRVDGDLGGGQCRS